MLIFRKAAADELSVGSGLSVLAKLAEVDVDQVGVGGAKNFFEAKVSPFLFLNFTTRLFIRIVSYSMKILFNQKYVVKFFFGVGWFSNSPA